MASPPTLFAVASADTLDGALEVNDRVAVALAQAVEQRELSSYRSLHALLWPEALQARNLAALRAAPRVAERALHAFDRMGVETSQLGPFVSDSRRAPPWRWTRGWLSLRRCAFVAPLCWKAGPPVI